jgi:hypothetical protein
MAIILKDNNVSYFVCWYHSPNFLDTPRIVLIAFVLQQLLQEHISVLRSTSSVCLSVCICRIIRLMTRRSGRTSNDGCSGSDWKHLGRSQFI